MIQKIGPIERSWLLRILKMPVPWFGLHIQDYMRASQTKDITMIAVRRNCLKALVFANREYIDQIIRNVSSLETNQISNIYSEVATVLKIKLFSLPMFDYLQALNSL